MKKLLLFAVSIAFAGIVNAQDCTSLIDPNADSLGLNPNPLAGSLEGVAYDEVNTLVLPNWIDNPFNPGVGDSVNLCAMEVVSVSGFPVGYNYDVWAYHSLSPSSNYDVMAQAVDTIHLFTTPVTRVCIRLTNPSPPASTDTTDGMPYKDSVDIEIIVAAYLDPGFGCTSVGGDTLIVQLPIRDAIYIGLDNEKMNSFAVHANNPNPANDITYLNFTTPNAGSVNISLFDAVGRNVRNIKIGSNPGLNNYGLSTSDLRSGVYIYNITFNGKTISKKLIINR